MIETYKRINFYKEIKMEKIKMMKVVSVDKNGFTLEDGTYCEHPIPLDEVPTLDEFQKIYENSVNLINKEIENNG